MLGQTNLTLNMRKKYFTCNVSNKHSFEYPYSRGKISKKDTEVPMLNC